MSLEENAIEFLKQHAPKKQQQGDITVKMAMDEWGYTRQRANDKLNAMVADGKLIKFNGVLLSGRAGNFFRITK